MIELAPFLLILLGWNRDDPAETMTMRHSLHISREACEAAGAAGEGEAENSRHFCIPAPTADDYEALLRRSQ